MKHFYRSLLRRTISPKLLIRIRHLSHIDDRLRDVEAARASLAEIWLRQQHPALFSGTSAGWPEFSVYSQNGEDGLLLSLLEKSGAASKTFRGDRRRRRPRVQHGDPGLSAGLGTA